jgi:hypothetical protein
MYRLRFSPSIVYQVARYSPSSRIATLTWSVQNVSCREFVYWSKRAFPCRRIKFGMQYATKLKADILEILHTIVFLILYVKYLR